MPRWESVESGSRHARASSVSKSVNESRGRLARRAATLCTALAGAAEGQPGLADTNGVVNMSATDHLGLDQRARVMVEIRNAKWVYQPR